MLHAVRACRPPRQALRRIQPCSRPAVTQQRCASSTASAATARRRGALIVFEGIDRCGKSTQCRMLIDALRAKGVPAQHWVFPDRTSRTGQLIDEYLKSRVTTEDAVVHLLFTANRFEKRHEMLQLLAAGTTLVCDRYSYSGVAYTAAKDLPHLGPDYCRSVEVGLPAADLVVHMDIAPEAAAARGGFGQERYEKLEFQRKVARQYAALKDERWLSLDATGPPEQLHEQVLAAVAPVVDRAARGALPLGRLWDHQPLELPVPEA